MEAIPCRYRACGVVFLPRRKGQVYHHPACRRADCLNRKYIPRDQVETLRQDAMVLAQAILLFDAKYVQPLTTGGVIDHSKQGEAWSAMVEYAQHVKAKP